MLEGVCGCIMACTLFLTGPRQVRKRVHCFIAELITYTVSECDAPECSVQAEKGLVLVITKMARPGVYRFVVDLKIFQIRGTFYSR